MAEETLEKLHVGCDDDGSVPIFLGEAGAAQALVLGIVVHVGATFPRDNSAVVFKDVIGAKKRLKKFAIDARGLLNDAGVWNYNDDSLEASGVFMAKLRIVMNDVLQSEIKS